jgi:hypothetical protein
MTYDAIIDGSGFGVAVAALSPGALPANPSLTIKMVTKALPERCQERTPAG